MNFSALLILPASSLLLLSSCSTTESDGRQYAANHTSPIAGKMGVSYRRVSVPGQPANSAQVPKTIESDGILGAFTADNNEPPGLLDRHVTPDQPGVVYAIEARQSPSPIQGKMGVRVTRKKKS